MDNIFIKNMVCNRCIMVVEQKLNQLQLPFHQVKLGNVELERKLNSQEKQALEEALNPLGFEIIDDKKSRIIAQIKTHIIELVHQQNSASKVNLSDFLSSKIGHDYSYLSNLFSEVEGTTIEKFYIAHRIEKVKELLVYDELTLSEIADRLHYSSVAYLSNQFKKITGLTPSHFKTIRTEKRKPLDKV